MCVNAFGNGGIEREREREREKKRMTLSLIEEAISAPKHHSLSGMRRGRRFSLGDSSAH